MKSVLAKKPRGAFHRLYRDEIGQIYRSPLALAVARLLRLAGTTFRYRDVDLPYFETASSLLVLLEPRSSVRHAELLRLGAATPGRSVALVTSSTEGADESTLGVPVVRLASPEREVAATSQALFVDDPSFAFDYAHILPTTRKCAVLHGHTSAVLMEIVGQPVDGMIVDFGEVKRIVRDALQALDHKLFIARRYVTSQRNGQYRIRFESPHGRFDLNVPRPTTYLLEGQATVENLAREVVRLVLPRMPGNVEAVGAYVYEGLNKGSHLLAAALHRGRS